MSETISASIIWIDAEGNITATAPDTTPYIVDVTEGGELDHYEDAEGTRWSPELDDEGRVIALRNTEERFEVVPPVPAGTEIWRETGTEEAPVTLVYTPVLAPVTTRRELRLPEGARLLEEGEEVVRGIDGKLYFAGEDPQEVPAEIRIREIKAALARIDAEYRTPRTLADAATGDAWAIARLAEAEALAAPLREELRELE